MRATVSYPQPRMLSYRVRSDLPAGDTAQRPAPETSPGTIDCAFMPSSPSIQNSPVLPRRRSLECSLGSCVGGISPSANASRTKSPIAFGAAAATRLVQTPSPTRASVPLVDVARATQCRTEIEAVRSEVTRLETCESEIAAELAETRRVAAAASTRHMMEISSLKGIVWEDRFLRSCAESRFETAGVRAEADFRSRQDLLEAQTEHYRNEAAHWVNVAVERGELVAALEWRLAKVQSVAARRDEADANSQYRLRVVALVATVFRTWSEAAATEANKARVRKKHVMEISALRCKHDAVLHGVLRMSETRRFIQHFWQIWSAAALLEGRGRISRLQSFQQIKRQKLVFLSPFWRGWSWTASRAAACRRVRRLQNDRVAADYTFRFLIACFCSWSIAACKAARDSNIRQVKSIRMNCTSAALEVRTNVLGPPMLECSFAVWHHLAIASVAHHRSRRCCGLATSALYRFGEMWASEAASRLLAVALYMWSFPARRFDSDLIKRSVAIRGRVQASSLARTFRSWAMHVEVSQFRSLSRAQIVVGNTVAVPAQYRTVFGVWRISSSFCTDGRGANETLAVIVLKVWHDTAEAARHERKITAVQAQLSAEERRRRLAFERATLIWEAEYRLHTLQAILATWRNNTVQVHGKRNHVAVAARIGTELHEVRVGWDAREAQWRSCVSHILERQRRPPQGHFLSMCVMFHLWKRCRGPLDSNNTELEALSAASARFEQQQRNLLQIAIPNLIASASRILYQRSFHVWVHIARSTMWECLSSKTLSRWESLLTNTISAWERNLRFGLVGQAVGAWRSEVARVVAFADLSSVATSAKALERSRSRLSACVRSLLIWTSRFRAGLRAYAVLSEWRTLARATSRMQHSSACGRVATLCCLRLAAHKNALGLRTCFDAWRYVVGGPWLEARGDNRGAGSSWNSRLVTAMSSFSTPESSKWTSEDVAT
eukprot:TRINITY_DN60837_c0_g1_i1.p1 TRINITY_DN60837_c0_g1~~TRINITY_DN60837_c0_g1_i1.p1  ORF type:complete len:1010 (-),score=127.09 TRINITY_DN60837_c0_g1_i1:391-3246(-)